jgi:hypothetical protein
VRATDHYDEGLFETMELEHLEPQDPDVAISASPPIYMTSSRLMMVGHITFIGDISTIC